MTPSPSRLTTRPPRARTGRSTASPTSRSSATASSSPASSTQSENPTRSVKRIVTSASPCPRPWASDSDCQTCSAPIPSSRSALGRSSPIAVRPRPISAGASEPDSDSESPYRWSPGSRWRPARASAIIRSPESSRFSAAIARFVRPGSSIARKVPDPAPALTDLAAGNGACDDEPLDLRRALEDRVDLRVAVPALDGVLARVAVAAQDVDRALGGPHRDLAGLELGHRALGVLELLALAPHPGGAPHEQPRGVDLRLHVGQRERDRLVLD